MDPMDLTLSKFLIRIYGGAIDNLVENETNLEFPPIEETFLFTSIFKIRRAGLITALKAYYGAIGYAELNIEENSSCNFIIQAASLELDDDLMVLVSILDPYTAEITVENDNVIAYGGFEYN